MTARLIHGILRGPSLEVVTPPYYGDLFTYFGEARRGFEIVRQSPYAQGLMKMVDEDLGEIPTRGKKNASGSFQTDKGKIDWILSRSGLIEVGRGERLLRTMLQTRRIKRSRSLNLRSSIYIPAARTGTIQFLNTIIQIINRLYRNIIDTLGGSVVGMRMSLRRLRRSLRDLGRFPLYFEEFYDLVLESLTEGVGKDFAENFRNLMGGQLTIEKGSGIASVRFIDRTGFDTEVERAASGVIASFPILLGLTKVAPGGTLVIEEPELDLEPSKQMRLIELICKIAQDRKLTVILTTHSDYVIRKLQTLVRQKVLRSQDVSLNFFDRPANKLTKIRQIPMDKTGEAEQPLFQEALETIIRDFSEPLWPHK